MKRPAIERRTLQMTAIEFVPTDSLNDKPGLAGAATAEAYETYFASGDYDLRYPRPNPRTLGTVLRAAQSGAVVFDIGAGNGRYAVPLALSGSRVVAVERSAIARRQLLERAGTLSISDSITVYESLDDVPASFMRVASVVLMLFGVLGHMRYAEREWVLRKLAAGTDEGVLLIGSVPNRIRRFRYEQSTSSLADKGLPPRFAFKRRLGGQTVTMEYTAFSPRELRAELACNGWACRSVRPESLLSESIVTSKRVLGAADRLLARVLPGAAGHCLFYVAAKSTRFQGLAR
jgi:tRNA (uracil-5-)-methyltransferase TRM9